MKHSEAFCAIAAALAAASAEFLPIQKNRTVEVKTRQGGSYSFTYATLDGIVAAVRPALAKNQLVMVQSVVQEEITEADGSGVFITRREDLLETRLLHSSGEWLANLTPVLISDGENSAQAYGSAITYARRYGITQLLCVVADEDDDGNAAAGNVSRSGTGGSRAGAGGPPISEKQVGLLRVRAKTAKVSEVALCTFLGVTALEAVPKGKMDAAMAAIENPTPDLLIGAGSPPQSEPVLADAKKACNAAAARNSESLTYMRQCIAAGDEEHLFKAGLEWRELSRDDKEALWLAPSKGGWFTTLERDAIGRAVSLVSARQRAEAAAAGDDGRGTGGADFRGGPEAPGGRGDGNNTNAGEG